MNRVDLIGRLAADPTVRTLPRGRPVANFTLVTNEPYKDREGKWQDRPEYHHVAIFGTSGERAGERLRKGDEVQVCGRLTYSVRKKDGTRYHNAQIEISLPRHWWRLRRSPAAADDADPPEAEAGMDEEDEG